MIHIADDHDALLDYLYEEGDPAERLKVAKHLQECAACSVAVLA
jgi:anti-sigma factor RsiW